MPQFYSLNKIHDISGGDESFVLLLVQTFLDEIPLDMASMQQAIAAENQKMAYQFAHKMKPNLDMFGIDLLGQIAKMESWSDSNDSVEVIKPELDTIISVLTSVIAELRSDYNL